MMILSPFRDYYDSCASHGVDMTVQYRRDSRQFNLRAETGPDGATVKEFNQLFKIVNDRLPPLAGKISLVYVGFCGKIYVGLRPRVVCSTGRIYRNTIYPGRPAPELVYQTMWEDRDVHKEDLDSEFQEYRYFRNKGDKTIREWMAQKGLAPVGEWLDLFQRQRAVAFVAYDQTLIIDPCLQDFKFQRVVGGVDAFQQIEMFISGVLGMTASPMIELTDKDRIQAHGFDERSFRREPSKRG